ncbi:MAG: MFS transporter, partial [Phycisphaerales bacterium]|nr:MFS transporter [Phycisphaerales bacterium]
MDRSKIILIILSYIAFIALGMPDGLLGVAWPSIRASFDISLDSLGVLLMATVSGYLISSFSSGYLISRSSVGVVLAASCALTGLGLIGYTLVPAWWMMVLLGIVAGLGAGAIDAGLNTYVATHFSERAMQWLHASYGIGVTLGPMIMTFTLTALNSWQVGYNIVGGFQWLLAVCFALTLSAWTQGQGSASTTPDQPTLLTDYKTSFRVTFRQGRVWLNAFLFLLYTGSEVAASVWAY